MLRPKISVIIPVYNVEKYLRRCLDSVLNQTFTDWQAICVNDGSSDNSGEILAEYASRDKRFVVVNQKNSGQSHARNIGTAKSKGEYIIYLDSDDFIHPQTMEIVYHMINVHNADMVSFGYDVRFYRRLSKILKQGINVDGILPNTRNKKYNLHRIPYFITNNILAHSTERNHTWFSWHPVRRHCYPVLCMYRRKLIENMPFIRGIIFEDFPWWVAVMLRRPRTVIIRTPLYFYMPNAMSSLNSSRARRMIESIAVGLHNAYDVVVKYATPSEQKRFNKEFLWPFTIILMRKVRDLDNDTDIDIARNVVKKLYGTGMFVSAPTMRARRYLKKIKNFISLS